MLLLKMMIISLQRERDGQRKNNERGSKPECSFVKKKIRSFFAKTFWGLVTMKVKEAIFDDETMLFALSIVQLLYCIGILIFHLLIQPLVSNKVYFLTTFECKLVYILQKSQVLFRICFVNCYVVHISLSLCHYKNT